MLQTETIVRSADNSGIKLVKCIKVGSGLRQRYARTGSIIVSSIKYTSDAVKTPKRQTYRSLIIGTKSKQQRADGTTVRFDENRVLTLSSQYKFLGSRVYGSALKESKLKNSTAGEAINAIKSFL